MKAPSDTTLVVTPEHHETALSWLSVLHDQPTVAEQTRFSRWLKADPAHAQAYAEAQVMWEMTEAPAAKLAGEDAVALEALLKAMDAPRPAGRSRQPLMRWSAGLAIAACLVLMVSVGLGVQPQRWIDDFGADYVSAPGQVRSVMLADGSRVTLDADSAVAVHFTPGERHVELRRGAAFFQVTHTGEPFVVEGGKGETRVLGTQFEVRLQPGGAQVTVLSGRVGVRAGVDEPQQILTAGQRVSYDRTHTRDPSVVDSESQLAWRQGWLNYYRTPLAQVIDDLSRYYPGRIVVLNERLAAKTVSGSFPSKDPLAVLAALKSVVGFEQYEALGRVIVIR
ncbi:FecR family protein [Pseudomonas abietaniphila]|uniref:FecR family protein n=1 Tax=Pseudomonas abietaniphila TaxID=89065 RepID=A0A1G8F9D4_9PSED|nr:FecR family protein [Pseudomonas abietaniphila]SDH78705.1 FecR family protein [Pseudomonas abietaniphila]